MRSVAALLLALGLPVLAEDGYFNIQVMPQECLDLKGHMGCVGGTRTCMRPTTTSSSSSVPAPASIS